MKNHSMTESEEEMLANERYDRIMNLLQKDGAVSRVKLAEMLGVTPETVRRDLTYMESEGLLIRVHGGAIAKRSMELRSSLETRKGENLELKKELSEKAAEFVREGDIIGIDVGTTAVTFADALKARFTRLTVITQSLDVFKELCGFAKFTVILLGGEYNSSENALDGVLTVQMLESLHMQKVFIFPCAISHDLEIFNFSDEMYLTERRMIKSADKVFVLADNTKFGKSAMYRIESARANFTFISDSGLSEEQRRHFAEIGGKVYCARSAEEKYGRSINSAIKYSEEE